VRRHACCARAELAYVLESPGTHSPILRSRKHRRKSAQDIEHGLPRRADELVYEGLLILGADLIEAKFPELWNDVAS